MRFEGFHKRFLQEMDEEIAFRTNAILTGQGLSSFEEYKRLVGERNGLVQAKTRYEELVTLMEQANEQ